MKKARIIRLLVITVATFSILLNSKISLADLHILYQNEKKQTQKIEIFIKNDLLKVINVENRVKIINLGTKTAYLYNIADSRYIEFKIDKENSPSAIGSKEDLFDPKISIIPEKIKKAKKDFLAAEYKSKIDDPVTLKLRPGISREIIDSYREALKYLYWSGNEILKEPFYHYSLKYGYIPIAVNSKEYKWKVMLFEDKPLDETVFIPPKEMTATKSKAYLKELVDKVSEDLESEIIP